MTFVDGGRQRFLSREDIKQERPAPEHAQTMQGRGWRPAWLPGSQENIGSRSVRQLMSASLLIGLGGTPREVVPSPSCSWGGCVLLYSLYKVCEGQKGAHLSTYGPTIWLHPVILSPRRLHESHCFFFPQQSFSSTQQRIILYFMTKILLFFSKCIFTLQTGSGDSDGDPKIMPGQ